MLKIFTHDWYLMPLIFIGSFLSLYFLLSPFPDFLPNPDMSDNGQHVRDNLDRWGFHETLSINKITFNENANSHYVPITTISFRLIYEFCKNAGISIETINLLVHSLNGVLFFAITLFFYRSQFISLITTLAFIFFPSTLEMLKWIAAGFNHGLTMMFCLLSTLFWITFLKKMKTTHLIISIIFFLLAIVMKPLAYFLPFCFIIFSLNKDSIEKKLTIPSSDKKTILPYALIYYIMLIPFLAIEAYKYPGGYVAKHWGGIELGIHPIMRTLDLLSYAVVNYTVYPVTRELLMFSVSLFLIFSLLYALLTNKGIILFWLVWTVGSSILMLSSNFRNIETILRYHYFPITGLLFIIGYFLNEITPTIKMKK